MFLLLYKIYIQREKLYMSISRITNNISRKNIDLKKKKKKKDKQQQQQQSPPPPLQLTFRS
jgi:hypothetical protein